MKIGYARVSKGDQILSLQTDALKEAGCERLFEDQVSGSAQCRPGLNETLSHLRVGDTLVVWKLDRLGRSIKNLIELTSALEQRGINLQSLTEGINTSTPSGKFFFHIMASLAQMERDVIIERTKAGLEAAKIRGRIGGRKRSMTKSKVLSAQQLLKSGVPPKEVASNLGVSVPTLYRWVPASSLERDELVLCSQ
jgi:DNA invertase Pin-like site-specific DNA recombinase